MNAHMEIFVFSKKTLLFALDRYTGGYHTSVKISQLAPDFGWMDVIGRHSVSRILEVIVTHSIVTLPEGMQKS